MVFLVRRITPITLMVWWTQVNSGFESYKILVSYEVSNWNQIKRELLSWYKVLSDTSLLNTTIVV